MASDETTIRIVIDDPSVDDSERAVRRDAPAGKERGDRAPQAVFGQLLSAINTLSGVAEKGFQQVMGRLYDIISLLREGYRGESAAGGSKGGGRRGGGRGRATADGSPGPEDLPLTTTSGMSVATVEGRGAQQYLGSGRIPISVIPPRAIADRPPVIPM